MHIHAHLDTHAHTSHKLCLTLEVRTRWWEEVTMSNCDRNQLHEFQEPDFYLNIVMIFIITFLSFCFFLSVSFFLSFCFLSFFISDQTHLFTSCLLKQPSPWQQAGYNLSVTSVAWKSTPPFTPVTLQGWILGRDGSSRSLWVCTDTGHLIFSCILFLDHRGYNSWVPINILIAKTKYLKCKVLVEKSFCSYLIIFEII